MLKKFKNYLKKRLRDVDRSEIVDIILFGSVVKGKEFPNDIDICIIFREKIDKNLIDEVTLKLKKLDVHISSLTIDNFFRKPQSLIKTLLVEGESILSGDKLADNFGFSSYTIYSYNLSKLKPSNKVRFVYLLKGRKNEMGVVKKFGGEWLTDSCFIIPIEKDNEISNIFEKWPVEYKKKEALIQ